MFQFVSLSLFQRGSSYLSHCVRQNLNDLLVRRCHDALAVDFDNAVANADASPLCDASSHQAADLHTRKSTVKQTVRLGAMLNYQQLVLKLTGQ